MSDGMLKLEKAFRMVKEVIE